jgi:outer membrane lipoprotein SlyB
LGVNSAFAAGVVPGTLEGTAMKKLLIALTAVAMAACTTTSPDVVSRNDAQRLSQVQDATVLSVRPVVVEGSQTGGGAVAGGVVGGIAGGSVGGRREAVAVGVLAAVAGAVVGNAVERMGTRENAFEVLIQLRNGERRSIVQAKGNETFNPGESVILVTTNGKTRVMKAPAVSPTPATVAPVQS